MCLEDEGRTSWWHRVARSRLSHEWMRLLHNFHRANLIYFLKNSLRSCSQRHCFVHLGHLPVQPGLDMSEHSRPCRAGACPDSGKHAIIDQPDVCVCTCTRIITHVTSMNGPYAMQNVGHRVSYVHDLRHMHHMSRSVRFCIDAQPHVKMHERVIAHMRRCAHMRTHRDVYLCVQLGNPQHLLRLWVCAYCFSPRAHDNEARDGLRERQTIKK